MGRSGRERCAATAVGVAAVALWSIAIYADRRGATELVVVAVASGVVAVGVSYGLSVWATWSWPHRAVVAVCVAMTPAVFAVGAADQLSIDGRPLLSTSKRANIARLALNIERDLSTVAAGDVLFGVDTTATIGRLGAVGSVADDCGDIADNWATAKNVDSRFVSTVDSLTVAADLCRRAAGDHLAAAETGDERVAITAAESRRRFVDAARSTRRLLSAAAADVGVPLTDVPFYDVPHTAGGK